MLILSIATFLLACTYDDLGPKSNPNDSKIIIETKEVLEPGARRLTFQCETKKIYPCMNFPLLTEKEIKEDSFEITFTSVGETALCLTAIGPATASVDLDGVSNGEYRIAFNNADLENQGTLIISDTEIRLDFEQQNGIKIVRSLTKRVPENTYWGIIGYHAGSSSALADAFIERLVENGAMFNDQDPGHYYYYEIDGSGDIVLDSERYGYKFARSFIFQYHGDEAHLRNLIRMDGGNLKADLSMRVHTFKGESITNWM